jgi:LmbE family N-acetylglucosaminyl deacetylase
MIRERPLVHVVYRCNVQTSRGLPVTWQQREEEERLACHELGCTVEFGGIDETVDVTNAEMQNTITAIVGRIRPEAIYAPLVENNGHVQHNKVGIAAAVAGKAFQVPVTYYATYTRGGGKTRTAHPVDFRSDWLITKWSALSCYTSQMNQKSGAMPHFVGSLEEFYGA